jgi:putative membrane protein
MLTDMLLAIAHHLFAFLLLACLIAEWTLLKEPPSRTIVRRLALIDAGYGIAAAGSLARIVLSNHLPWRCSPARFA